MEEIWREVAITYVRYYTDESAVTRVVYENGMQTSRDLKPCTPQNVRPESLMS
jgi:hypothetical protein